MNSASGWSLPRTLGRKSNGSYSPVSLLGRPFSSLIDDLFEGRYETAFLSDKGSFVPRVEVTENDNQLLLKAEVPGLKEEDVEITLTKTELTLRGEKKQHQENKEGDICRSEWMYGSFERTLPLTFEVDEDKVEATFKDGILSVILPKSKKAMSETKKVSIKRV